MYAAREPSAAFTSVHGPAGNWTERCRAALNWLAPGVRSAEALSGLLEGGGDFERLTRLGAELRIAMIEVERRVCVVCVWVVCVDSTWGKKGGKRAPILVRA